MALVQYIQHNWPQFYWSANFIAALVLVVGLSAALWMVTRWSSWLITGLTAIIYLIPFYLFLE